MNDVVIKLDGLQYRWPGNKQLLLDIPELTVTKGEKVFIKGASGSGKTTLLSLIGGINTPEKGAINLLQKNIVSLTSGARDQFRSDHIGFIFQMFNLIPYLSVLENIVLPCQFSAMRANKAMLNSQTLYEEAHRLLVHLKLEDAGLLQKPVGELSVGQQQRVATARALIGKPEIIIADEPTSALDSDTRESFLQLLMKECTESDSTLLFVSHDSALEKLFDRTVVLNAINKAAA